VALREAPLDGTLFLFTNRAKDSVKGLVWTHGGFLLFYNHLASHYTSFGRRLTD
jgi:transposase